jgi:DNA-binding LytR/AlgR family response regulator
LQVVGHTALATAFTLLLYWLLMILIGLDEGESFTQFVVKAFFPTSAFAWQLLQGLALYTVVACLTYLRQKSTPLILPSAAGETVAITESPSRYLIRVGEDIIPIDTKEIVSIRGADDYAEVATIGGRHLVRMTLAEFEKSLNGDNFIRVHRSHIVNVDLIERAEPAGGGRMLLHMENGEMIPSSRAGSRLLRDRVI